MVQDGEDLLVLNHVVGGITVEVPSVELIIFGASSSSSSARHVGHTVVLTPGLLVILGPMACSPTVQVALRSSPLPALPPRPPSALSFFFGCRRRSLGALMLSPFSY